MDAASGTGRHDGVRLLGDDDEMDTRGTEELDRHAVPAVAEDELFTRLRDEDAIVGEYTVEVEGDGTDGRQWRRWLHDHAFPVTLTAGAPTCPSSPCSVRRRS